MGQQTWFCRSDEDLIAIGERLKLTRCSHCQVVGALNWHGYLRGFDDSNPPRKTIRARRVFCSNRNARPAAGTPSASGSPTKSDDSA